MGDIEKWIVLQELRNLTVFHCRHLSLMVSHMYYEYLNVPYRSFFNHRFQEIGIMGSYEVLI